MTARFVMARDGLDRLVATLAGRGYEVVGPTVRDGVIGYGPIRSAADLPAGWTDHHEPGRYRLERRDDDARFGYVVGPHSWKRYLHPPREVVWSGRPGFEADPGPPPPKRAFLGVRPCELAAIRVHDAVFTGQQIVDDGYAARRRAVFLVAVECTEPGGTCFCTSMGTGPDARGQGFDLALVESIEPDHVFLVRAGSAGGDEVIRELGLQEASRDQVQRADEMLEAAAGSMGRRLETDGLPGLLARNLEHPIWDEIAARCLACANCTLVCPTCFCTTVHDELDLDGAAARRVRTWDSCFSLDFSYIHGGPLRATGAARYRQWITHKLSTWWDQFGTSGCVGCGRCITWCPVGIDITAEAARLRAREEADHRRQEEAAVGG